MSVVSLHQDFLQFRPHRVGDRHGPHGHAVEDKLDIVCGAASTRRCGGERLHSGGGGGYTDRRRQMAGCARMNPGWLGAIGVAALLAVDSHITRGGIPFIVVAP
jgi:hypothetical protein